MARAALPSELAKRVWAAKYRYAAGTGRAERSIADTWRRVAAAVAKAEPGRAARASWARAFGGILRDFAFLPGGRILAGAGVPGDVTLASCFVMDAVDDSFDGIFDNLRRSALTMQWGGGIGCDFSALGARGTPVGARGAFAPGPVTVMQLWDAMCATLVGAGARRGAMMATLRCDHPDVAAFVEAKRERNALRNFNLSVGISDAFMAALAAGGQAAPRALWDRLMAAAYDTGEPGVLFLDRINRANNLHYCERITATNPCGEIPLPAYGACVLGSLNLTAFVRDAFSSRARLDLDEVARVAALAVRFLDDVIDVSRFPLDEQAAQARAARRTGLGVTGLADALIMLGLRYDSDAGRAAARVALERIRDAAYTTSVELAAERGSFPSFQTDAYLAGSYVSSLPAAIRDRIAAHGIRNSHLLAIAPAGTISLLAGNVSSGIEPVFALESERRIVAAGGSMERWSAPDFAFAEWRRQGRGAPGSAFVTAGELAVDSHLAMVAALQPLVDNSISKTVNVAAATPREAFAGIYERAYALGLKGCTVFRPSAAADAVVRDAAEEPAAVECCEPARRVSTPAA